MKIRYLDIVNYVKENHVDWNTDIFDVLKDYFSQYSFPPPSTPPIQQELIFPHKEFKAPANGEYSIKDVLDLFSS